LPVFNMKCLAGHGLLTMSGIGGCVLKLVDGASASKYGPLGAGRGETR